MKTKTEYTYVLTNIAKSWKWITLRIATSMIDLSSMASGYEMNEMRCVPFSSHASAPRRKATLYNHHTSNITLEMTSFSKLFILLILFNSLKSKQWKLNVYKLQSIAETTEKIIQSCQEFPLVDRFSFWPILVRHHTFVAELPIDKKKYAYYIFHLIFLPRSWSSFKYAEVFVIAKTKNLNSGLCFNVTFYLHHLN